MFTFRSVGYNCIEYHPLHLRRPQGLYEFYLLLYTKASLTLLGPNGSVPCRPGSLILFRPYSPQNWDTDSPRMVHHFCTFEVSEPNYFKNLGIETDIPIFLNLNKEIDAFFAQLNEEFQDSRIGKTYKLDSLINGFFVNVARKLHTTDTEKNLYGLSTLDQFEKLRLKIYEDPAHCVQYYASESGFSVRRFEHYYKQFFQISPKDDLTKARLLSAQDKLSSGLPYEEIAESLGFGSSEYFYKWYRAHLGTSPKTVAHKK